MEYLVSNPRDGVFGIYHAGMGKLGNKARLETVYSYACFENCQDGVGLGERERDKLASAPLK